MQPKFSIENATELTRSKNVRTYLKFSIWNVTGAPVCYCKKRGIVIGEHFSSDSVRRSSPSVVRWFERGWTKQRERGGTAASHWNCHASIQFDVPGNFLPTHFQDSAAHVRRDQKNDDGGRQGGSTEAADAAAVACNTGEGHREVGEDTWRDAELEIILKVLLPTCCSWQRAHKAHFRIPMTREDNSNKIIPVLGTD